MLTSFGLGLCKVKGRKRCVLNCHGNKLWPTGQWCSARLLPIIKLRYKLDYQKKYFNAFWVLSESIYVTNGAEMSLCCRVQHRKASADPPYTPRSAPVQHPCLESAFSNTSKSPGEGCTCHNLLSDYSVCDLPLNPHSKSEHPKWYSGFPAPSGTSDWQLCDRPGQSCRPSFHILAGEAGLQLPSLLGLPWLPTL